MCISRMGCDSDQEKFLFLNRINTLCIMQYLNSWKHFKNNETIITGDPVLEKEMFAV